MADKKDNIVLSIRDMSKSFGRNRVLTRINLDVKAGTVMGLMGENGAGKSTMMKCLFGTYQKDEGNIFLDLYFIFPAGTFIMCRPHTRCVFKDFPVCFWDPADFRRDCRFWYQQKSALWYIQRCVFQ